MNIFELSVIQSYSICIASFIGLVRFKRIDKSYRPFIFLCWIALMNELISTYVAHRFHTNAANANIYVFVESVFFAWLFRNWGFLQKRSWHYPLSLFILLIVWLFDNLIWHSLREFNSFFRIFYSFFLIFLAINYINWLFLRSRGHLLRHAGFLICIGILIFYSYKATIEVFYLLRLNFSNNFYNKIHHILEIINLFVNLVYALAVLWIPKKQKFILPY